MSLCSVSEKIVLKLTKMKKTKQKKHIVTMVRGLSDSLSKYSSFICEASLLIQISDAALCSVFTHRAPMMMSVSRTCLCQCCAA